MNSPRANKNDLFLLKLPSGHTGKENRLSFSNSNQSQSAQKPTPMKEVTVQDLDDDSGSDLMRTNTA